MHIHFIGIGGIGVSALAQYYLAKGHQVSGSDLISSEITEALKKKGVKIFIGKENPQNLSKKFDLIFYSPAVKIGHRMSNFLSYPEALGELTKKYFTIAVSGTHGKSTTTAMIGLLLTRAGLDPTVIVGTKVKQFGGSNCRVGKSKYLVIEADEHFASFLNYWPKIIVLTNIEKDHLDYYKNLRNILKTFKAYINHLPKNGFLIVNKDDKNAYNTFSSIVKNVLSYSLQQKGAERLRRILKVPGEHNVSNALAAITTARILKIPDRISFKALSEYKGSWRRFEIKKGVINGKQITVISDYAHHPTEIRATLEAAKEKYLYPPKFSKRKLRRASKKIWCVFQPHQYQRTYYLFNDFVKVLRQAQDKLFVDKIIITDIFDVAGREEREIKKRVGSEKLVEAVNRKNVIYLPKEKTLDYLKENISEFEVLIIMGAGDVYKLVS